MIRKKLMLLTLAVISLTMMVSCGDRDNPADPDSIAHGLNFTYPRKFNIDELNSESGGNWVNYRTRNIRIYTPPGYVWQHAGEGKKFPTLYLLHDFNEGSNSYLFGCLNLVVDRLIAEKEINPMVIVMVDASTIYGGSFYTDNWNSGNTDRLPGNFEKMIYHDLIKIMEADAYHPPDTIAFSIITRRASRAIGGIGSGGYGALKIALKHPELFSSVSLMNGFTAFDGDTLSGLKGIRDLVDSVFVENEIEKGNISDYYNSIDTSYFKPYSNLFYSMAAAFSPHDPLDTDTSTFIRLYGVDLPFDYEGNIVQSVWDKWLENDLSTSLLDLYSDRFDSTALYFEYSDMDQYFASDQAKVFTNKLNELGIDFESSTYSGYPGYPATHDAFNFDYFADMLKFHSKHLNSDPGEE